MSCQNNHRFDTFEKRFLLLSHRLLRAHQPDLRGRSLSSAHSRPARRCAARDQGAISQTNFKRKCLIFKIQQTVPVGRRQGQEDQAVRPSVHRLHHDVRPKDHQRRNGLSHKARYFFYLKKICLGNDVLCSRSRFPVHFRFLLEEDPPAAFPCHGSHLPCALQG